MSEEAQKIFSPQPVDEPEDSTPGDRLKPAIRPEKPEQTLEYITELTDQLARLAASINEDSIAYFLSMARAEAELVTLRQNNQNYDD